MSIFKRLMWLPFAALVAAMLVQSCRSIETPSVIPTAHAYDNEAFFKWNEKFLELDRYAKGYRPGPGPRTLSYLGLAAYEGVVAGIPENNSMRHLFHGLDLPQADQNLEYHWPTVVNESYAYLMKRYFFHMEGEYPDLFNGLETLRRQMDDKFSGQASAEAIARSKKFGQETALGVYEWSKTDEEGHNAFLNPQPVEYVPPTGPGLWQPTAPNFARAMFPYWGRVRRFAMRDGDILSRAPIPYSEAENSLFYTQALEVYNVCKNITDNGPGAYEARWIAEFWSDDLLNLTFAPPPRMMAIANQIIQIEKTDLALAAELYGKLGLALSDAGVAIWHSKYYYNVERPVSYIRRIVSVKYPDAANWVSLLNNPITGERGLTPAFPAYPSGHSGFGGAGGKVLASMFENTPEHPGTYSFVDNCHVNRSEFIGTPRTFASFKDMANEDAYSRIPLGVHFRMDCDEGLRLGELAAQRVLEMPWKK